MQDPSFAIALQLRILSLTETVEICLCRLPLQVAKYHESADGDVAVVRAASQSFLHCLGVVHLAIAHDTLFPSKPFVTAVGILDKLLIELRVAGKVVKNERGMYDPAIDGDTPPAE